MQGCNFWDVGKLSLQKFLMTVTCVAEFPIYRFRPGSRIPYLNFHLLQIRKAAFRGVVLNSGIDSQSCHNHKRVCAIGISRFSTTYWAWQKNRKNLWQWATGALLSSAILRQPHSLGCQLKSRPFDQAQKWVLTAELYEVIFAKIENLGLSYELFLHPSNRFLGENFLPQDCGIVRRG